MNKKGQLEEVLIAIPAVVFASLISFFFIFALAKAQLNKEALEIRAEKLQAGDNLFFISYLKSDDVTELIRESYASDNYDLLKSKTNTLFTKTFGMKICWKLYLNDKEVSETKECTWLDNTKYGDIVSIAYIPYGGDVISVGLGEKP